MNDVIEGNARLPSDKIRKGLFESAQKIEARRKNAYDAEIRRQQ